MFEQFRFKCLTVENFRTEMNQLDNNLQKTAFPEFAYSKQDNFEV